MNKPDWDDGTSREWWPTRPVDTGLRIPSPWEAAWTALRHWIRAEKLRRSRRALRDLDDHQLFDIGLTREEAERESRRSFHLD